jgi:group I intron endonuclease
MPSSNTRNLYKSFFYEEIKNNPDVVISGIYKIENLINHKIYIGQSKDIFSRWKQHLERNRKNKSLLYRAFNKYGYENFSFEIIKETYDRNYWEIFLIQLYKSTDEKYGYNISIGGDGGDLGPECRKRISESLKGHAVSEETKKKISKANKGKVSPIKGKKFSEETRKKMSDWQKGLKRGPRSDKIKIKISNKLKGHVLSQETKNKISLANKGKHHIGYLMSAETKEKLSKALKGKPSPMKGKYFSDEIRHKLSESHKGHAVSEETKKKISMSSKGKKISKEACIKISESKKGTRCYNNGVISVFRKEPPEGDEWKLGQLKTR